MWGPNVKRLLAGGNAIVGRQLRAVTKEVPGAGSGCSGMDNRPRISTSTSTSRRWGETGVRSGTRGGTGGGTTSASGRERGGDRNLGGHEGQAPTDGEGGAAVEAVPAEPQDQGPEGGEHAVVGLERPRPFGCFGQALAPWAEPADAGPENGRGNEGSHTTRQVYDPCEGDADGAEVRSGWQGSGVRCLRHEGAGGAGLCF